MRALHLLITAALVFLLALSGCKPLKHTSGGRRGHYEQKYSGKGGKKYSSISDRLQVRVSDGDDTALFEEAAEWIGVPYKYGGNTKKGVDCSGLVVNIYKKVYNKKLYRNSAQILERNCKSISKKKLRTGDLVFFATGSNKKRVNHVGIYLKNGKFIHSSSSKGVIISDMNDSYYIRTYIDSGRVI